jgi:peptidoglycan L-alanyl-D-glutamate endopeptidase CwlK
MSALVDQQANFLLAACKLIEFATSLGYKVTGGELERSPEQAKLYAKQGKGIVNSPHCARRAIDLNFYIDGMLKADKKSLDTVGRYWESLGGIWGGRFKAYDDSRHFEM